MLKGVLILIAIVILLAAGFRKMEDVDFFSGMPLCRTKEDAKYETRKTLGIENADLRWYNKCVG